MNVLMTIWHNLRQRVLRWMGVRMKDLSTVRIGGQVLIDKDHVRDVVLVTMPNGQRFFTCMDGKHPRFITYSMALERWLAASGVVVSEQVEKPESVPELEPVLNPNFEPASTHGKLSTAEPVGNPASLPVTGKGV